MSQPRPFVINIPNQTIASILNRVRDYEWLGFPEVDRWSAGTALTEMREIADYWASCFDWRKAEASLNRLPHQLVEIDGNTIHYMHLRGSGTKPFPLILTHGWPGSFFEFMELAEPLAHPERFGGSPADAFDVIVPSLPGFVFSGRPPRPIGPRAAAGLFHELMTNVLGYKTYLAQGGDLGAVVSTWLAQDYPQSCVGIHLNFVFVRAEDAKPTTPEEIAYVQRIGAIQRREGAYIQLQSTKPQTLAYAMMDSPVGVAAWIIEKFAGWSDLPRVDGNPDIHARYSDDQLLTDVMLYLVTKSFATSLWMYRGMSAEQSNFLPVRNRITVPVGVAAFPDPYFPPPPRSLAEKSYNITHWTDMPRGGHFAALEEPSLLIEDIRSFSRLLR